MIHYGTPVAMPVKVLLANMVGRKTCFKATATAFFIGICGLGGFVLIWIHILNPYFSYHTNKIRWQNGSLSFCVIDNSNDEWCIPYTKSITWLWQQQYNHHRHIFVTANTNHVPFSDQLFFYYPNSCFYIGPTLLNQIKTGKRD